MCENSASGGCEESERRDKEKENKRQRKKERERERKEWKKKERRDRKNTEEKWRDGERRTDHVRDVSVQRLRKTHKQAYYNNGRACCTNTISA